MTSSDHTPHHDQPTTAQRLAEVLGWQHAPELTDAAQQQITAELDTAEACRIYGLDHASNAPVAEWAPQQPAEPIRSADDLIQPGMFHSDQELAEFLADLRATRHAETTTTTLDTIMDIHHDLQWLKHALQALLDHHRIRIHDPTQTTDTTAKHDRETAQT